VSFYLVAGQGAPTDPSPVAEHLPTQRPRRYPSDTDDDEWAVLAPSVPVGATTAQGGRPPQYPRRDVVDAIRYVDRTSCQWRALPADFPLWDTVYHYFRAWNRDGTLTRMHDGLRMQVRQALGRNPDPTAAAADSQTVRAAETVAKTSRGYDAGNYADLRVMPGRRDREGFSVPQHGESFVLFKTAGRAKICAVGECRGSLGSHTPRISTPGLCRACHHGTLTPQHLQTNTRHNPLLGIIPVMRNSS
jgi:transposase